MQISFYNKHESKIEFTNEILSFHPNILLFDFAKFDSMGANHMISYLITDEFPVLQTLQLAVNYYKRHPVLCHYVDSIQGFIQNLKELSKEKHKSKEQLVLIGRIKNVAKASIVHNKYIDKITLVNNNLFELIQFSEEDILKLSTLNYFEEEGKENLYIQELIGDINNCQNMFCLEQGIEKLFRYQPLETINDSGYNFIKIPLWDFPSFAEITYDKMNYAREQLKPALVPFKKQLIELNEKLSEIYFTAENFTRITQLYTESINPLIAPVQTQIDESLYLMQQKSKYPDKPHVKFCLGLAPTLLLIDYYEKNDVLIPYVASEIKQQLSRQIDLNRTCVFSYYEVIQGD